MSTVWDAKRQLIDHQQQHVGILDHFADLIPFKVIVFHPGLVAADSINGLDSLLLIKEACLVRRVGEKDDKDNGPDEGDEAENDKEPLPISVSYSCSQRNASSIVPSMPRDFRRCERCRRPTVLQTSSQRHCRRTRCRGEEAVPRVCTTCQ